MRVEDLAHGDVLIESGATVDYTVHKEHVVTVCTVEGGVFSAPYGTRYDVKRTR